MIKTCKDVYVITESQSGTWVMYNSDSYSDDYTLTPGPTFIMLPLSQDEFLDYVTFGDNKLNKTSTIITGTSWSPDYYIEKGACVLEGKDNTGLIGSAYWTVDSIRSYLNNIGTTSALSVVSKITSLTSTSSAANKGNGLDDPDLTYASTDSSGWWMCWQLFPEGGTVSTINEDELKFHISEHYKTVFSSLVSNKS